MGSAFAPNVPPRSAAGGLLLLLGLALAFVLGAELYSVPQHWHWLHHARQPIAPRWLHSPVGSQFTSPVFQALRASQHPRAHSAAHRSPPQLGLASLDDVPKGQPLVEIPLFWFVIPERLLGSDYVLLPLYIDGRGPFNFLVDTGLTINLLTPQLCQELAILAEDKGIRGLAGDGSVQVKTVDLKGVTVEQKVPVPSFTAAVIDFPQRGYAEERGIVIHGMVGMQFLEQFDLKYARDTATGVDMLSVYRATEGHAAHASDPKWKPVNGILMPKRLMAVQIAVNDAPEPFLGVVDSGASYSIMNLEAAKVLGYDVNDPKLRNGPGVTGVGVLGQEVHMPIVSVKVCLSSFVDGVQLKQDWMRRWWLAPLKHDSRCVGFEHEAVVAIGEMNFDALTALPERGLGAYKGPLVLTGQDVLTQREVIFCGAAKKMLLGDVTGRFTNA
eukprot:EG_transcript_10983